MTTRSSFTVQRVDTNSGLTDYKNRTASLRVDDVIFKTNVLLPPFPPPPLPPTPTLQTRVDDILFFVADNGTGNGFEMFYVNGDQTIPVDDSDFVETGSTVNPNKFNNLNPPKELTVVDRGTGDRYLFFSAADNADAGDKELWTTPLDDSYGQAVSPAGTKRDFTEIEINPTGSGKVEELVEFNSKLYFRANDGTNGTELWSSDGDTANLEADIFTGSAYKSSNPTDLTPINTGVEERLFFKALTYGGVVDTDQSEGQELWVHDPNENVTQIVTTDTTTFDGTNSIVPGPGSSSPSNLTVVGDTLFFVARSSAVGRELWRVDNSVANVAELQAVPIDIKTGSLSSTPTNLTVFDNDNLVFNANDNNGDNLLYKYEVSTSTLTQIPDSGDLSQFSNYYVVDDGANKTLFFTATRSDVGNELWAADISGVIDGDNVESGIQPIVEPYTGVNSSAPSNFSYDSANKLLYFNANGIDENGAKIGKELWRMNFDPSAISVPYDLEYADIFEGDNGAGVPNGSLPNSINQFKYQQGAMPTPVETVYFSASAPDSAGNFTDSALFKVIEIGATVGDDTITGSRKNDNIDGLAGNDILDGDTGIDRIIGGDGNDTLIGGSKTDTLVGGNGSDSFQYDASDEGSDVISDFNVTDDTITFKETMFGGGLGAGAIDGTEFRSGAGITDANDGAQRFIYNETTGDLFFDIDGNGVTPKQQLATLTGAPVLTTADIVGF